MSDKNEEIKLPLWILCGIFLFSVLISSVVGVPDIFPSSQGSGNTTSITDDEQFGKVNLNTAIREELITLPGIGESLADRIIAYREENGPFQTIEDLINVKGIGESKLESLRELITV